jgi:predicted acyltransferase
MKQAVGERWPVLDVFRGLAVAGMILVTSPGAWDKGYAQLRHAAWNGWTVADMIFPAFLFGVGMALAVSFPKALEAPGERARLWRRVARRVLGLILLGLALNMLMEWKDGIWLHDPGAGTPAHVRIPGVLQRIALCYLIGVTLILATARTDADGRTAIRASAIAATAAGLLLLYWLLLTFVPVPGFGVGRLDQAGNLTAWIDRAVFTPMHMWRIGSLKWAGPVLFDPEGLLSTLTATVNLLLGILAAYAWQRAPAAAPLRIAIAGAVLMAAGLLIDPVFPINKLIWTSSFALVSGGFSALVLAALMVVLRSDMADRLAAPLRVLGSNAVLAFALSILAGIFGNLPIVWQSGAWITPQQWGNGVALGLFVEPYVASLACALAILALITLAIWPLHRRGIHLRL